MADKKISQLTALSAANVAPATDVLAIVDTSATETKKITAKDLIDGALNGGTANGVLYLNGSKVATSGSGLTFNGTGLGIQRTASAGYVLDVDTSAGNVARIIGSDQANVRLRFDNGGAGGRIWELVGGLPGTNNANFSIRDVTGSTTPLTIDSSGNLGIGTASPTARLHVAGATGEAIIQDSDTAKGSNPAALLSLWGSDARAGYVGYPGDSNMYINQINNNAMLFLTNNTERGRFTAGGEFLVNAMATVNSAITSIVATASTNVLSLKNGDNGNYFLYCASTANAERLRIEGDGDVYNLNGTYGTISDERLKQDIVDAPSQWDDIKAVRFRKYRMKTDVEANPDAPAMLGVVAQELAQVSPGLVDEHPNMKTVEVTDEEGNVTQTQEPDGTTTMTVKSSILLMKAAVALQEAMARIEQLEAKVAALESA